MKEETEVIVKEETEMELPDLDVEIIVVESELSDASDGVGPPVCAEEYAAESFQVTVPPCEAGSDMILFREVKSVKATAREVLGHEHAAGLLTVSPSSSHAIHSLLSSLYVG